MDAWQWVVTVGFLAGGIVLAMATTTSNRLRWAVLAPLMWGLGMLFVAVVIRSWSPIAIAAGMLFYAAINYREIRRRRDAETGTEP